MVERASTARGARGSASKGPSEQEREYVILAIVLARASLAMGRRGRRVVELARPHPAGHSNLPDDVLGT